jgi:membrane-bound lytic murein transglycosylase F
MVRFLLFNTLVVSFVLCCTPDKRQQDVVQLAVVQADTTASISSVKEEVPVVPLEDPFETKTIKLLITNHFNTYFVHRGGEYGLEFELLQMYLKKKGMKAEFELIHDIEDVEDSLLSKGAHMAAASFVIQKKPIAHELYSDYLYRSDLVLVQREEKGKPVTVPSASNPVKVHVIKNATYVHAIVDDTIKVPGLEFVEAHHLSTRQSLVEEVAEEKIDYTICDDHEAEIMKYFHPNLNIGVVIKEDTDVGFMFHPEAGELVKDFNEWLHKNRNTSDYQWTIRKYKKFSQELKYTLTHTPPELFNSTLSKYDHSVKKYAVEIDWDWKLLSALIYQESRFDPRRRSWVGAIGLMQVMPRTGMQHGIKQSDELYLPEKNLMAGTSYIRWLEKHFFKDEELDPGERMKFLLASYNAGPGHVIDARALARKNGLDPNVWDDNVEKMILAKSYPKYYRDPVCKHGYCRGKETSQYVDNIMTYYEHYANYVEVD